MHQEGMAGLETRLLLLPPPVAAMEEVSVIEVEEVATVVHSLPPEAEEASGSKNLTVLPVNHLVTVSGKTASML